MLSAPYLHQDRDDKLIWMLDSRGGYTVKSCSAAVAGFLLPCQTMNIPNVWKPTALPKVEFFTWLVVLDRLNTKEFFAAPWNNYTSRNVCCCCQTEEESLHHQLQHCQQVGIMHVFSWRGSTWTLPKSVSGLFQQ